jgi:hypothetical protein
MAVNRKKPANHMRVNLMLCEYYPALFLASLFAVFAVAIIVWL